MITVVELEVPAGSLLVRLPVDLATSVQALPAPPPRCTVTATVADGAADPTTAQVLAERGYRFAGELSTTPHGRIDLLITPELRAAAPGWWREVVTRAERVYDLEMGPVQRVLAGAIETHLRAR